VDSTDPDGSSSRYVTGEEMVYMVADNTCKGSPEDASRKILQDFRSGRMGPICLQVAPDASAAVTDVDSGGGTSAIDDFSQVPDPRMGTVRTDGAMSSPNTYEQYREKREVQKRERALVARETAKQRGLELPPQLDDEQVSEEQRKSSVSDNVGKGFFDGW
jgi:hypothetical protein